MKSTTKTTTLVYPPRFPSHRPRQTPGLPRHGTTTTVGGCGEIYEEQSDSKALREATFDGVGKCREGTERERKEKKMVRIT